MEWPKLESARKYEYFVDPKWRQDVYRFAEDLSKYLHDKQIPNIVFIDRSARPAWVALDEYWKNTYPNEKRPNIYFINPDGFDVLNKVARKDNITHDDLLFDSLELAMIGSSPITRKMDAEFEVVREQFNQAYKELNAQKDKPLAIYDNCIHTGKTIIPVVGYLAKENFKDVRLVVGDDSFMFSSPVYPHKTLNSYSHVVPCSPFGSKSSGVKKEDDIFSRYDEKIDRREVTGVREEIRKIVRNKGK